MQRPVEVGTWISSPGGAECTGVTGFGYVAGLIWLAAVVYLLTLGTRLVRAIERIATKFESKP